MKFASFLRFFGKFTERSQSARKRHPKARRSPERPRSQRLALAEPGQSTPGGQERVLGGVLGIRCRARHQDRGAEGEVGMALHQLSEGVDVSGLGLPDESGLVQWAALH